MVFMAKVGLYKFEDARFLSRGSRSGPCYASGATGGARFPGLAEQIHVFLRPSGKKYHLKRKKFGSHIQGRFNTIVTVCITD